MNKHKIALYLIVAGVALNVVDAFTTKDAASGGAVFGANGFLKGIDASVPHPKIMSVPINTAGWMVIAGAGLWAFNKWA